MGCIRIERERGGFSVSVTDPEIQKRNDARNGKDYDGPSEWTGPNVEYPFETNEQVLTFLTKAIDIALPADDYSSAFDKIAKEATEAK